MLLLLWAGLARSEPAEVGVYLGFEQKAPAARILRALQRETALLLEPAGVSIGWRMLAENKGTELFPRIFVVRFKGACNGLLPLLGKRAGADPFEPPARLGSTSISRGKLQAHAEVECDHVSRGVERVAGKSPADVFASALAKVVAHELYHFLSGSAGHGKDGLARPVLVWADLDKPEMRFASGDLDALRRSLTAVPTGSSGAVPGH